MKMKTMMMTKECVHVAEEMMIKTIEEIEFTVIVNAIKIITQ